MRRGGSLSAGLARPVARRLQALGVEVLTRGESMLAHRAMAQGAMVAELISGHRRMFDGAVKWARLEDIGGTIHAHPTLGEAFHEASRRALSDALHNI